jgi:glyoxylase-like metal-dependent hydrolase (beta-lactamase superfamily II)/ferredoxin
MIQVARLAERLPANAGGDFYVDSTCIACDTCRRIAPLTFGGGEDDVAFVARQPAGREAERALMALVACPVAAIGTVEKHAAATASAARAFPEAVVLPRRGATVPATGEGPAPAASASARGCAAERAAGETLPDVYGCGYAAEASFGAASWLVVRPGGNVLVDSPRFARPLLRRIRELGGARYLFLTHRDDVADHARWRDALGCERVLHARDVTGRTRGIERPIEGEDPVAIADDLTVIPVPGHTAGSAALLYRDEVLFTGDHLWGDAEGRLGAGRSVCWYDWGEQTRSMERLVRHRFRVVLPGHGRPWSAPTAEEARGAIEAVVRRMR